MINKIQCFILEFWFMFKASPNTCFGGGVILPCKMTEGADVSDTAVFP